ncbi:DUF447 domain-containing protein [Caldinitratiruptor microaerophilus]|uniref:DUF447 family protein n=1 Tax=Caldinitratiruptor microaerophilus TaxID=671077 RepID=A0AA35CKZ5_9FIRM|nr:DUF447 domain-containing protein [Caldinitratiruptor microaerophilus]BDG60444.1 hypothetical protein caldi_15340 [Caldinitratiruptor microaerophilus]
MILECIVTTRSPAGCINVAPMGVVPRGDAMVLRPFRDTTTYRNLVATRQAVVNSTDDACLFAHAALGDVRPPFVPARRVHGAILAGACRYWEVEVESIDGTPDRAEILCRVVAEGRLRDFIGFNRARHALLEATILATRLHVLPPAEVVAELERLALIVRKTGDPPELEAMAFVRDYVERWLARAGVAGGSER